MEVFGRVVDGPDLLASKICRMFLHSETLPNICTMDSQQGCHHGCLSRYRGAVARNIFIFLPMHPKTLPERGTGLSGERGFRIASKFQGMSSPYTLALRLNKLERWICWAYPTYRVHTSSCSFCIPKYRRSEEATKEATLKILDCPPRCLQTLDRAELSKDLPSWLAGGNHQDAGGG